ncbi:MAG: hypothetical protein ABIL09_00110 [Gemmatimonadota bacterium]
MEISVDAAGQLAVLQRGVEVLRTGILLPWLAWGADPDGGTPGPPRLTDGKLSKEDVHGSRHYFRLTGVLPLPPGTGAGLEYEARFHLGAETLLAVEYVRLRNPGPAVRLAHWEHRLELRAVAAAALRGRGDVLPAPVPDLVLEAGAQVPVLAVRAGERWLVAGTPDLAARGQGALTLRQVPGSEGLHHLGLHCLTPERAGALCGAVEPLELAPGAALSFAFTLDLQDLAPAPEQLAAAPVPYPLRRTRPAEALLVRGVSADDGLARRLRGKVEEFTVECGPLAGLHCGGYDHLNGRGLETPANRAEAGHFLLNEYLRSGDEWWLDRARRFGRAHLDLLCLAGPGDGRGGVRPRGRTTGVDPLLSCRTAHLFLHLHALTGDPAWLAAARANGEFLVRRAAAAGPGMAAACGELAVLWYHTGDGSFGQAARQIARQVAGLQGGDGGWAAAKDGDSGAPRGSRPAVPASACAIGLLDMSEVLASDEGRDAARRALDWMVSVQRPEGALPGLGPDGGLCGASAFQDALALLLGYRRFEDEGYRASALRVLDWAEETWDRVGYLPAVVGAWPADQSEASLGYFYGLEAAALRRELTG